MYHTHAEACGPRALGGWLAVFLCLEENLRESSDVYICLRRYMSGSGEAKGHKDDITIPSHIELSGLSLKPESSCPHL
jgi:hypothetical protein